MHPQLFSPKPTGTARCAAASECQRRRNTDFYDGGIALGHQGLRRSQRRTHRRVYRFEASVSTKDASQGGRLAYAGLSGGFGSISLGQVWNAAYNHVGVITDKSYYFGNAGTGYRHGNALSYAFSSGALGFQLDLISDGGEATGKAIDKTEFGVTIGLGEVGKVALAHTNQRDKMVEVMPTIQDWINTFEPNQPTTLNPGEANTPYDPGTDGMPEMYTVNIAADGEDPNNVPVERIMVMVDPADSTFTQAGEIDETAVTNDNLNGGSGIVKTATGYSIGDLSACSADGATTPCLEITAYVRTVTAGSTSPVNDPTVTPGATTATYYVPADVTTIPATDGDLEVDGKPNTPTTVNQEGTAAGFGAAPESTMKEVAGHKTTHVAVEFSVGGVTPYLGYSKEKKNGSTQEKKTTHYGLSGSLGDTGVGYLVAGRSIKDTDGMKTSPWLVNVWKDLGGGATVIFGHGNDDNGKSGKSRVGLHVGF